MALPPKQPGFRVPDTTLMGGARMLLFQGSVSNSVSLLQKAILITALKKNGETEFHEKKYIIL